MLYAAARKWADANPSCIRPGGFGVRISRWLIELDREGNLVAGPLPEGEARRGRKLLLPGRERSGLVVRPILVHDKTSYVLPPTDDASEFRRDKHRAYLELLERCVDETGDPLVGAVRAWVTRLNPAVPLAEFDGDDPLRFRVEGSDPVAPGSDPAVWWADVVEPVGGPVHRCLVCGLTKPAIRLFPTIKGVSGAATSGASLTSSNEDVFERHGRIKGDASPTCHSCAEAAHAALNHFLGSDSHHVHLGGASVVWWDFGPNLDLGSMLTGDDPDSIKRAMAAYRAGHRVGDVDASRFCAAVLVGNEGRVSLASWIDTTIPRLQQRMGHWFGRVSMTRGGSIVPPSFNRMARALLPPQRTIEWKPIRRTTTKLLELALSGGPAPRELLAGTLNRIRAQHSVFHAHAALLKLALCPPDHPDPEKFMTALNPDHPSPAYQSGRLLSVIGSIQHAALGETNTTVIDRYYGAASSRPATVFPNLIRGAQPHLSRLKGDTARRGRGVNLERKLSEILSHIAEMPRTLDMNQQAQFALGYYHQREADMSPGRRRGRDGDLMTDKQEEEA